MFRKDHQGILLLCQLKDEATVQGKVPDVSFIPRVEKDGACSLSPEFICVRPSTEIQ